MVKEQMKTKLSRTAVDLWFGELQLKSFENNTITFTTTSEFKLGIIKDKYLSMIEDEFEELMGFRISINVEFNGVPADVEALKKQIFGQIPDVEYDKDSPTKALEQLVTNMEVETLDELQPMDMNDDEILPDAAVYDLIRFVIKDLEAEGKIDCPCHSGSYDLRYAPGGIQAFCPDCGATYFFPCESAAAAEEYLNIDEIKLK